MITIMTALMTMRLIMSMTQVLFWEAVRRSLYGGSDDVRNEVQLILHVMSMEEDTSYVKLPLMHVSTLTLLNMTIPELDRADPPHLTEINECPWLGAELLSVTTRNSYQQRDRLHESYWNMYLEVYPEEAAEATATGSAVEAAAAVVLSLADAGGNEHDGTQAMFTD